MTSYTALANRLNLDERSLPITADWSATPDFLQLIIDHCLQEQPKIILECSSGLTSLMLARCCQINETGKVYSLENGEEYALKTRAAIEQYHLSQYANIIDAPLTETILNASAFSWYCTHEIPDSPIDMLVIDGPPGFIQRHSRYPALPMLFDKLSDHCVIFLDDAARKEEQELVAMWLQEFGCMQHQYINNERGCSILTINKAD